MIGVTTPIMRIGVIAASRTASEWVMKFTI